MEMEFTCPLCSSEYSDSNPPRLIQCGHTFCHSCLAKLVETEDEKSFLTCPEHQQSLPLSSSLQQLPKNIALIKIIEGRKKNNSNNSSSSLKDASFDMSKINKEQECQEDDVAQELISEINRASINKEEDLLKNGSQNTAETCQNLKPLNPTSSKSAQKEEQQVCLLHQRPIQVVCMNDYERLCSKCALFGQHKTHDFKSIEEIERENAKYYQEIIRMFEEKATFMERVANKTVEKDLLELLSVKTNRLRKEIGDKFKKLADELAKAEKSVYKRLEDTNKTISQRLKSSLQLDSTISHAYDLWEERTLEAINQSQKPSSDGHLSFYLKKNEIVQEGKQLLEKLQRMQEKTYSLTVQIIEDFTITFHDSGFQQTLQTIAEIIEHKKEDPKNDLVKLKQNEATLANCQYEEIKKVPQLNRQESEESLLDACDFETHSFVGSSVGSKMLDQSFVSVKDEPHHGHTNHAKDHTARPLIKRKAPMVHKEKQKIIMKQTTSHITATTNNAKKKLKGLKVPQKYEKVLEGIANDTLQTVDLTNAELGDSTILQILEMMRENTKVKTLKLIRNKLSDEGIAKMIPLLSNILSLNLSQNQLTENTLNTLIDNRGNLPLLRTVVLSQTKIVERKSKPVIQKLKKLDVGVSV